MSILNPLHRLLALTLLQAAALTASGQATYPMTQTYEHNPLFVDFPSPLYGQSGTGHFYSADPSARVWTIDGEERLYVYCSHDIEPAVGCDRMDRYHVFSTTDLKHWTDHGEIFNSAEVNAFYGDKQAGFMWAPDCLYNPNDGLYYYYFPHATDWSKGEWKIFVATSKDPATGFELKGVVEGMPSAIDPMVFLDTTGQPYIYNGGGGHVYGGKLDRNDWTRLDGEMKEMTFRGNSDFHEGAWVFKRNGGYYLTYPDNHSPQSGGNQLRYAVSNNPLGPWTERGVYMLPHGEETAHGSVVQFQGQWYQFYHTGNYSGEGTLRSVCFDPIEFSGTNILLMRTWGTPRGGTAPTASLGGTTRIEAENYNDGGQHYAWYRRPANGEPKVTSAGDRTYVASMKRKEWMRYSVNFAEPGMYAITCCMRRHSASSKFTVGIDGRWPRFSYDITTPLNQWGEMEVINLEVTEAGEHYIEWRSQEGDVDLDWLQVERSQVKVPGTVEAEDFDKGGEGVAYHWQNETAAGRGYRDDAIFIESHSGGHSLGWSTEGDWTRYTITVKLTGTYRITTYCSSGGEGAFKLMMDDRDITPRTTVSGTGGWGTYKPFVNEGIALTRGEHVLTFYCYGGINVDRFDFECTQTDPQAVVLPGGPGAAPLSPVYDLAGHRLDSATSSPVYIQNGRKYINH